MKSSDFDSFFVYWSLKSRRPRGDITRRWAWGLVFGVSVLPLAAQTKTVTNSGTPAVPSTTFNMGTTGSVSGYTVTPSGPGPYTTIIFEATIDVTSSQGVRDAGGATLYTLLNNGVILSSSANSNNSYGVYFSSTAGGILTNHGTIEGLVSSGVYYDRGPGNVTNMVLAGSPGTSGLIRGGVDGLRLIVGGTVSNGAGATIIGTSGSGIDIRGVSGTVGNLGEITGGAQGVYLEAGGDVTNGQGATISATSSGSYGVRIAGAIGTGSLDNAGQVSGSRGAQLAGGSLINRSTGSISGGAQQGVYLTSSGTVSNAGSISSSGSAGIFLTAGGSLFNGSADGGVTYGPGAQLTGASDGIQITGASGGTVSMGPVPRSPAQPRTGSM